MRGHVTNEFDVVGASAYEIWAVYGDKNLPTMSAASNLACSKWKEKFVTMDDCKMVKQVQQIEGGFLGVGFKSHLSTMEIVPKDKDSCIIKSTVTVDIDSQSEANASFITVDSMYGMARAITKYLLDNKAKA
ncbi:hypothetical protein MKW94_002904 [Papaver nudicaule]|uniref:Bet v I/Major latex protein domain-containing protein n=1 Tax=Papaver nudicaule TaxID=74823 RepID=A0AA42AUN0_PAPNU|nr:hypothetical protein [Papaver nudicaule]